MTVRNKYFLWVKWNVVGKKKRRQTGAVSAELLVNVLDSVCVCVLPKGRGLMLLAVPWA